MKPKFRPFQSSPLRLLNTLMFVSFAATSGAFAASATWNGTTDATWATGTNWSATPVPGTGDTATFNNAGNANTTIDLGAGVTIANLSFSSATAAAYTIGSGAVGSQSLTLNGSGSISMDNAVVNNQLINANVNLGATDGAQAFTISNLKTATNTLTIAGGLSTTQTGVKTLTVNSAGLTNISGAITDGSGTLSLNKTGTNLLTLSGAGNYSGGTLITGLLNAANNSALGTGSVTVNNAAGNQLQLANGVNVSNALIANGGGVTAQGILYVPTGTATYSGSIALNAAASAGGHFASAGQTSKLTIAGDNTITATIPVNIRNGWVTIAGAQNYATGTTLANAGALVQFGKTTSMPASGTVSLVSGTTLAVNAGGAGEFTPGAGAGTIGGLLAGTGGQGAPVTLPAGTSIAIDTTNAAGTVAATSAWTSTNNVGLLKLGTGTLSLSNGGTYVGAGYGGYPFIARQGTLLLNGGTHTVTGELVVGGTFGTAAGAPGLDATLQVDSGTLAVSSWLSLGRGNGIGTASSNLIANNSAVITSANFSAGFNGGSALNLPKGTFTLNNNASYTVTGNGAFNFAESSGSHMTMTINNSASVTAAGTATKLIGQGGTGIVTVNGGSLNFGNGTIHVGNNGATGPGTLTINGGAVTTGTGGTPTFNVGYRNGTGTLNVAGGTFSHTGEVRVAGSDTNGADNGTGFVNFSGGTATMNGITFARGNNLQALNNGTGTISGTAVVNSGGDVTLGFAGAGNLGKLTISGGTLNVGTAGIRALAVGNWDTSRGELNISGGNVNLYNGSFLRMNNQGTVGANVVNQSGGTITTYTDNGVTVGGTGGIDLQRAGAAASNNTYNFTGGTIVASAVFTTQDSGTAAFNFGGGTLRATGNNANFFVLGGANQKANVLAGGAKIDSNGFNVTVAEPLLSGTAGDGGLTKLGAGTLTLTGANTYNGPTTVAGGTLLLAATSDVDDSSGITINGAGAKLQLADYQSTTNVPVTLTEGSIQGFGIVGPIQVANNAANTITVSGGSFDLEASSLTFQGAATLNMNATGAFMNQVIVVDDLTTNASGQVVVNASNSNGVWLPGDYTIIYYDNTFTGSAAHFAVGSVPGLDIDHQTASIVDLGGEIVLRIEGDTLTWTGLENSNWTTGTVGGARNWWYPSTASSAEFTNGSPVLFDDSSDNESVILTSDVAPAAVVFDNTFNDYVISGSFGITGGGSLTKNGIGLLTISTANTYTGVTTLNDGVVEITGAGTIGSSSEIMVGANANLILSPTGTVTYPNPITGSGDLTKNGAGTLTLSGANTISGDVTLNAGQLNLNSAGALGTSAGTPPGAFIINGGILDNTSGTTLNLAPNKPVTLNSDISFIGSNNLYLSNGQVTLTDNRTVTVQAGLFGMGAPVDGANTYTLTKAGPGTLVLNGGDIGGNLNVQAGIVGLNQDFLAAAPLGTGILQNAGNVGSRISYWNPATDVTSSLLFRNNDGSSNFQLGIIKRGPNTLTLNNAANNATWRLHVDQGRLVLNGAGTYGSQNDDGSTNTNLTAFVGWDGGANSVLEINGATVNYNNRSTAAAEAYRSTLNVANAGTSVATVKLNSGSLSINRQLALGVTGSAFGAMTQTGGTANVGGFLALGLGTSRGVFNLSGGTYTQAGPVTNGAGGNSIGLMNIGGTAVYNQTSVGDLGLWVGEGGNGTLNVTGSASVSIVAANDGLQLGRGAAGVGTVNLNGGTTTVQKVYKGAGTGILNFGGGTLAANTATANFLTGLSAAYVNAGGGTIHNAGNAITIGQALMAPVSGGVTASGVSASGGGFIDTPIVTIDGDGTGATAVANVDSGGNLTGITITNPGVNYTFATMTLVGGGVGNTGNITGAPLIVANTSGGMTFSGSATTTLTAVNTYTGNTTISAGTTLAVPTGGAITVKPTANNTSSKITGAGTLSMVGSLRIDLSSAAIANGNVWNVVDVTNKVYTPGFFSVTSTAGAFTEQGDGITHVLVDGGNTWTFNETTGQLSLSVVSGSSYDTWANLNNVTGGATDDDEFDGITNLMEFVLNGNPQVSDTNKLPVMTQDATNFYFDFNRRDDAVPEVSLTFEHGSTLAAWPGTVAIPAATDGVAGPPVAITTNGDGTHHVKVTIPKNGATKLFGRLKAEK